MTNTYEGLGKNEFKQKNFAKILSEDGTIRIKAEEGDPEAITRHYKTPKGLEGDVLERVWTNLTGIIKKVSIREVIFEENNTTKFLEIYINNIILSVDTGARFAMDIMKKLPNIDFEKEVVIAPYSFIPKGKTKKVSGVNIYQNEEKLYSFFTNKDKENLHGFPEAGKDTSGYDSDDWKVYYIGVEKFLVKYTRENIIPKFPETVEDSSNDVPSKTPEEKLSVEDIETIINEPTKKPAEKVAEKPGIGDAPFVSKSEEGDLLLTINEMANAKIIGIKTPEDMKQKVMEATGLAFISPNLQKIVAALDKMPVIVDKAPL